MEYFIALPPNQEMIEIFDKLDEHLLQIINDKKEEWFKPMHGLSKNNKKKRSIHDIDNCDTKRQRTDDTMEVDKN